MIKFLKDLFGRGPAPRPEPIPLSEYLLRADCFEQWVYETVGGKSLNWLELRDFLEKHSQILERELAWINKAKGSDVLTSHKLRLAVLQTDITAKLEPECHICGGNPCTCTICFGDYAR